MSRRVKILPVAAMAAAFAVAAIAPAGAAAGTPVHVKVIGPKKVQILQKVLIVGTAPGPDKLTRVRIDVRASGRRLFSKLVDVNNQTGRYKMPLTVAACCKYVITAKRNKNRARDRFSVTVPNSLKQGKSTKYFHTLLRREGYHLNSAPGKRTLSTDLAIRAFRSVNGMGRSSSYSPGIYKKLAQGRGAFKPKEKRKGRYVEADISRQVMSLIEDGKPKHTVFISSGASSSPTVRGHFRFYLKQPGYNAKRMYYSVYFTGNYATHGYDPVPTYPASHGCLRNPIPFSVFLYNWIDLGDSMYVYN